ncbi:hypothetical protein BJX96DRAFT_140542 [Aspergillus floccosus]
MGHQYIQDLTNSSVFHLFTLSHGYALSGWRPHSYIMRGKSLYWPSGTMSLGPSYHGRFPALLISVIPPDRSQEPRVSHRC